MELEVRPFSLRDSVETALGVVANPAAVRNLDLVYDNQHHDFPDKFLGDVTRFRQILLKYPLLLPLLTKVYWAMLSSSQRPGIFWSNHKSRNNHGTLLEGFLRFWLRFRIRCAPNNSLLMAGDGNLTG